MKPTLMNLRDRPKGKAMEMLIGLYFISGIIALVLVLERMKPWSRDDDHRHRR